MRRSVLALPLIAFTTCGRAEATPRFSVGGFGGYASEGYNFAVGGTSAYRLGFGARAGVSLPRLYLGLVFTHHLGTRDVIRDPGLSYDARYNSTLSGPEIGYDAPVGTRFMLRPYVGGGALYHHSKTTLNGSEVNKSHWRTQFSFGVLAAYRVGQVLLGVDVRGIISPLNDPTRWTPGIFATVGYSF